MGLLLACMQTAHGFDLHGPDNEAYQTSDLGYMTGADNGAPKNVAEEYRRVIPTLYWSVDQSFLDYFGTKGLSSVEGAFRILNALTNVSSYSLDLTEFPLESKNINYRAQALGLIDMRSSLLAMILENMGLGEADRYIWCLRSRTVGAGGCPDDVTYVVQKRNWEFVPTDLGALKPSSYVNGIYYSYLITENCTGTPVADAVEFPADPSNNRNTAAASFITGNTTFADLMGAFLIGLTRDDVAGLRYLYRAGNINWEPAGTGVEQFVTNYNQYPYLIYTSNLTQFAEASKTNDADTLMGLYQGLQVITTSNYLVKVINTNTYSYVTNEPWGTGLITVYGTNYTTNIVVRYSHTFGDSFRAWTNSTWSTLGFLETRYESDPWMPAGTTPTNKTYYSTMLAHVPSGAFYIMSNSLCDVEIVSTQLVTTMAFTNQVYASTNAAGGSNTVPIGGSLVLSQSVVYVYKDYILAARPVTCETNTVGLRRGMERTTFIRRDYDSMLGRYWEPVTNQYSRMGITNSTEMLQRFRRVATAPDFLLQADSETANPQAILRTITFDESTKMPNLAGPGTIDTPVTITFNKIGPTWRNTSTNMDEATALFQWNWGSFTGSTNAPVVFPEDAGIDALERQMLMQVTTGALPSGKKGKTYPVVHMTGTGGMTPYTWGLADGSPGLPPGLSLSTDGTLSGIPALAGTFDFMVQMTDAGGASVLRAFAVRINP